MAVTLAGFGASTLLVCLLAPLVGSTSIHLSRVFDRTLPLADNVDAQVFFVARLPRVVAAGIVGAGLAIYHMLVERGVVGQTEACSVSAPGGCATKWIDYFGYLTIPTLTLTAFGLVLAILLLAVFDRALTPQEV